MLGALCHYVTHADPQDFQPMKANFGIVPELEKHVRGKRDRKQHYAERALKAMRESIETMSDPYLGEVTMPEVIFS
jgi:methylenetetrahydrofolate--tRNA-(uracil-5-)-methyltransferase